MPSVHDTAKLNSISILEVTFVPEKEKELVSVSSSHPIECACNYEDAKHYYQKRPENIPDGLSDENGDACYYDDYAEDYAGYSASVR